ncbi:MAG TPA: ATP-binding protein [Gemmatimonadales bacterium]|jgi:signal transduction histidine kinase
MRLTRSPIGALRLKLTAWYFATLCATLLLLGGGLFLAIGHQFNRELIGSLRDATAQLERAARTRELESHATGAVVDAVEELHIDDRDLFLLAPDGTPITPALAEPWIRAAAQRAGASGEFNAEQHVRHGRLQLHAERFVLASGRTEIAVAIADKIELEDRYSSLIAAFGAASAGALLLVLLGGWFLVRQSTGPIETTMARMRQFMADAAHELRTPVTVLRTQAEVALDRPRATGEYVAALQSIESESRRVGRIVDDLLTLARADAGERRPDPGRVFLDDIVADAVGAAEPLARVRRVTLKLCEFEEAVVAGDGELLRQLVMILLDNAIKFTPPDGRVSVTVGRSDAGASLSVVDSGCGIPAEQLPHVFERFYRGDLARQRGSAGGPGGAGLGLSIAQWIVQAHMASITLSAAEGGGTRVDVRFPPAPAG